MRGPVSRVEHRVSRSRYYTNPQGIEIVLSVSLGFLLLIASERKRPWKSRSRGLLGLKRLPRWRSLLAMTEEDVFSLRIVTIRLRSTAALCPLWLNCFRVRLGVVLYLYSKEIG